MFKRILEGNQYFWLAFHVVLGVAAGLSHGIIIAWLYFLIASTLMALLNTKKQNDTLHHFFAYYITFEIFTRILRLTPFIPVESGKYLAAFFLLIAIAAKCHNTKRYKLNMYGVAICLLSMPSILMMQEEDFWDNLVFSGFGIFDLGLFVIYFSNYTFSRKELNNLFRLILYPLISISIYLVFNTPSLDKLSFNIGANHAASGHFGPNQVSTIFGTGIFILGTALILNYRMFKTYYFDIAILMLFIIRGLLTFSRGGIFSAILALVVVFLFGKAKTFKQSSKKVFSVLILGVLVFYLFNYINKISGNNLLDRYEGQTYETELGGKEQDVQSITDGRSLIISAEFKIFLEHPMLGVGPGQEDKYWDLGEDLGTNDSMASHTEFSRLLAENGILGLIICLLLLYPFLRYWLYRRTLFKRNYAYYLNLAYLTFAISMCTHSAMRTMITPFFFGLAFAGMHTLEPTNKKMAEPVPEKMDAVLA